MEFEYHDDLLKRVLLGAIVAAADECGLRKTKKTDFVYWAFRALEDKTFEELERLYRDYVMNDFK